MGHTEGMDDTQDWYWDLVAGKAVRADERGPGDDVLGPYPTREAAENWKQRVDARNEHWDDADEQWAGGDDTGDESSGDGVASSEHPAG